MHNSSQISEGAVTRRVTLLDVLLLVSAEVACNGCGGKARFKLTSDVASIICNTSFDNWELAFCAFFSKSTRVKDKSSEDFVVKDWKIDS